MKWSLQKIPIYSLKGIAVPFEGVLFELLFYKL